MHKTRSQARREAWESGTYNPFGKIPWHKRVLTGDEEANRVATNRSENCMTPSIEQSRLSRNLEDHPIPRHATSMPPSFTGPPQPQPNGDFSLVGRDMALGTIADRQEKSEDSANGTSETAVDVSVARDSASHEPIPRKRRPGLLGALCRKNRVEKYPDTVGKSKRPGLEDHRRKSSEPFKKDQQKFTFASQIRATLLNSWINILLVFVPVGIAVHYAKIAPVGIFVINFIAIIPLAAMLSYATEEIALRVGETLGGLLNATFGNAVELIVSILALTKDQVDIVQESLIGSMLSNLLLVMGMSFFLGGITRIRQHFNLTVAQTASSLLALAVGSLIIPAAFRAWAAGETDADKESDITALSRGTALLLLVVYGCYLLFQLKTHIEIYNTPSKKVEKRSKKNEIKKGKVVEAVAKSAAGLSAKSEGPPRPVTIDIPENIEEESTASSKEEEPETPQLSKWVAVLTLAVSTALVALCAEGMVSSIDAITESGGISRTFVGLILLPIVGNAAEHATAVTVAIKDKMDLSIGVAVGSSMQIALLVIPLMVVLGWILGEGDVNLAFDGFQIIVLFVSILLVNYLIQDGESHWLEGVLLFILYVIIAVAAWYYPRRPGPESGGT